VPNSPCRIYVGAFDLGMATRIEQGHILQRADLVNATYQRSQSWLSKDDTTIPVHSNHTELRPRCRSTFCSAFLENSTDPRARYEDQLLEPCPSDPVCTSVSDMMEQHTPTLKTGGSTSIIVVSNAGHCHQMSSSRSQAELPIFSNYKILGSPSLTLPKTSFFRVDSTTALAECLESMPPARDSTSTISPAAIRLPQEIVRHVYYYLAPPDFNSARHTCRLWYISSLEHHVLETMLERGGWVTSFQRQSASHHHSKSQLHVNIEWLMSKFIARECALGPDWTGNGVCVFDEEIHGRLHRRSARTTPFICTSTIDFTEFGPHSFGFEDGNSGITFTMSTCGRFLMVAQGCLVYIYQVNKGTSSRKVDGWQSGSLEPVTSVICPSRVLACSMDTSSHRYAIAVLMDGRMGLVCELTAVSSRSRQSPPPEHRTARPEQFFGAAFASNSDGNYRNHVSINSSRPSYSKQSSSEQVEPFTFPVITAAGSPGDFDCGNGFKNSKCPTNHKKNSRSSSSPTESFSPLAQANWSTGKGNWRQISASCFPIEQSVPTIYRSLCSADDPPRSVALCPQRRCVAFGCSAGIELYWVDALTGQDLNRWFPLTAPSDYLFFLPPRAGVDSAKKLRLISSSGRAGERPVVADKFISSTATKLEDKTNSNPFWASLSNQYSGSWLSLGADSSRATMKDNNDHYRAVPLSDGYHILFIDPKTGLLCLGSDAPVGGPTKLLRKMWFAAPSEHGSPVAYAVASEMKYGVRVVAAYGTGLEQRIWLFSVPSDIFIDGMAEHGVGSMPFVGTSYGSEKVNREWVEWFNNPKTQDRLDPIKGSGHGSVLKRDNIWPLPIRGQEIGRCSGLSELTIQVGLAMTIWAFTRNGVAHTWQIDEGSLGGTMSERFIARDGTVRECDSTSKSDMTTTPSPFNGIPENSTTGGSFDGTASIRMSTCVSDSFDFAAFSSPELFDAEGDTIMTDSPGYYTDDNPFEDSFNTVAFTIIGQNSCITLVGLQSLLTWTT
jgi:hypothetical protein